MHYFTIISPVLENYQLCEDYIKENFKESIVTQQLCDNEYIHLNIIFKSDLKTAYNVTRKITNDLIKKQVSNCKNIIITKRVENYRSVIENITKGNFAWIFVDNNTISIYNAIIREKNEYYNSKEWEKIFDECSFSHFAIWFIDHHPQYNLPKTYIDISHLHAMIQEGYYVSHLIRKIKCLSFTHKCLTRKPGDPEIESDLEMESEFNSIISGYDSDYDSESDSCDLIMK